ncbi:hypothetical protein Y024_4805 [Burkholderia pseudomallei TSV44]|nr:hypothetical protein Y024_4805 [Burkholderia pseudomallei TSV44]
MRGDTWRHSSQQSKTYERTPAKSMIRMRCLPGPCGKIRPRGPAPSRLVLLPGRFDSLGGRGEANRTAAA